MFDCVKLYWTKFRNLQTVHLPAKHNVFYRSQEKLFILLNDLALLLIHGILQKQFLLNYMNCNKGVIKHVY